MYAVKVKYQNQYASDKNSFTYLVGGILLNVGDLVVVPVLEDYIFKVAKVVDLVGFDNENFSEKDLKAGINYRWVVQRLGLLEYKRRLKESSTAIKPVEHKNPYVIPDLSNECIYGCDEEFCSHDESCCGDDCVTGGYRCCVGKE